MPDYVIKEESLCHKTRKEEVECMPLFAGFRQRTNETVWLDWTTRDLHIPASYPGLKKKLDAYESLKTAATSLLQLKPWLKPASNCEHNHKLTLQTFGDRTWIFTAVAYLHAFRETRVIFQWH